MNARELCEQYLEQHGGEDDGPYEVLDLDDGVQSGDLTVEQVLEYWNSFSRGTTVNGEWVESPKETSWDRLVSRAYLECKRRECRHD